MNVSVSGPKIMFTIPVFGGIGVSETIVNSWIIMAVIMLLCLWLTHGMNRKNPPRRQIVA